jgi:hypothetical protein
VANRVGLEPEVRVEEFDCVKAMETNDMSLARLMYIYIYNDNNVIVVGVSSSATSLEIWVSLYI